MLAGFEPVLDQQTDTIVAITEGDVDWPTLDGPDGESYTLDRGSYREAMDHPDRGFRRRAHEAHLSAVGANDESLAAALAEKVRAQVALADARNFASPRAMALARERSPATGMHDAFPESAHDAVVEQVRAHADAYHDLLESRRATLGVDVLRPWDESAPLATATAPTIAYEDVREQLLEAVAPLGERYRDRLAAFLDDRRVDVYPTAEKRTDIPAYCPSSPDTGAFVLANFREDVRTAFFLAHELGHAMHVALLRDAQPARYVTIPQPVSEVPSILHELLFADHLLAVGDEAVAVHVRERRAAFLGGNVFGAGRSAAFLHEVYETVAGGGDLTPDGLAETYAEYATEIGAPVEPATEGEGWRQHAFAREPYHSYQYVVGAVAAVSLYHRLRDGTLGTDGYLAFLASTGKRDALEALEAVGVDVTAPDPYERVATEVREIAANRDR